jgi:hypothetical protein
MTERQNHITKQKKDLGPVKEQLQVGQSSTYNHHLPKSSNDNNRGRSKLKISLNLPMQSGCEKQQ